MAIHNAFGTEYNWPWYEGLLGNANYYSHGPFQNGTVNIVGSADSSTAGLPATIPFKDEWYNLVPYPTNVKFLATVDETTLAGKDEQSPGPRQLPPGRLVPVLRRRPRLADDAGPRHAGFPGRLGLRRARPSSSKLIVQGIKSAMGLTPFCQ